jgi:hypothetical protein
MKIAKLLALASLLLVPLQAFSQMAVMDGLNEDFVILDDGTRVQVYRAAKQPGTWYYLPSNLRLSNNGKGDPAFLYMKYVGEKKEEPMGAILSAMFEYGLSADQLKQVKAKLEAKQPKPWVLNRVPNGRPTLVRSNEAASIKLLPAPVVTEGPNSFQVISAVLNDRTLTRNLIASGRAPTFEGEKIALAANLGPIGAQLFSAPIEKRMASSDLKLQLTYSYYVMSPAIKATLSLDFEKIKTDYEKIKKDYSKTYGDDSPGLIESVGDFIFGDSDNDKKQIGESYKEVNKQVSYLRDKGYIQCNLEITVSDEMTQRIAETYLQMFASLMTQPINLDEPNNRDSNDKDAKQKLPEVDRGQENSTVSSERLVVNTKSLKRTYTFTASVPVKITRSMTTDLLDLYDGVKNNPRCVGEVLLNDPFFTHCDVKVFLDLDAKDIFDETINYVTVSVRKRRTSGNDFLESVTMDAKYLKENGPVATLSYARGSSKTPDPFEYQVQWSLRGGKVYPPNPTWQPGALEGVTLTAPLRPTQGDFQWDPDAMKEKDLIRVSTQVVFWQFGEEKQMDIQPLPDTTMRPFKFFRDSSKSEFAYRLVYYHKTQGVLAGPWQRNTGGLIYGAVPEDLLTNPEYKERGTRMSSGTAEKVLGGALK